jgi:hypothetical protein
VETDDLARVYRDIIWLAESGTFLDPAQGWTARMVIAHLAVNDMTLLRGLEDGVIDNADALDEDRLRHEPDPLGSLQATSVELIAFVDTIDEFEMGVELPVRVLEEGVPRIDHSLTVAALVEYHTSVHLTAHLWQLGDLIIRPRTAPGPSALNLLRKRAWQAASRGIPGRPAL